VRNNPVLWLAAHAFLPYDSLACALLLFTSRKIHRELPTWEKEITEFDTVCALARFQWENPHCNLFEENAENFFATELGHPLLSPAVMEENSFSLSSKSPMVLLTGSNMSGKSTFLRTLGINTLLFNMGAPVCARQFSAPIMRILCAIRVDDSLSDGMSYFYAEVKRLKSILSTLQENRLNSVPSMFLVDEIFRGTNNRERFVGSWSILHTLLDSGAFGLVSTHDLALTELATRDTRMRNQHFREHVENSKLVFDYKIKDGPCPTTNALAIMAAEGLPILDAP
jgi:DNA mismatch repair ATPase MutS